MGTGGRRIASASMTSGVAFAMTRPRIHSIVMVEWQQWGQISNDSSILESSAISLSVSCETFDDWIRDTMLRSM